MCLRHLTILERSVNAVGIGNASESAMLESLICTSVWWQRAAATHDRHRPLDQAFTVVDHLIAVRRNVDSLLAEERAHPMRAALE
jgi:hypothetical protein